MTGEKGVPYHRGKAYNWMKPGEPCWYQPALESRPFAGVISSELFDSSGDLCVRLEQMDERYQRQTGRTWIGRVPWYLIRKRRIRE